MLNFVTALHSEAKPLIAHYKLKRVAADQSLRVYANQEVQLIVGGIGTIAAAAATAYLQARSGTSRSAAWLNVGIAGHDDRPIGDCVLAHKIIDSATGQTWFPQFIVATEISSGTLISYPTPAETYEGDSYADMEAAGYFATASRFAPAEIVHCFKIVSDNRLSPKQNIHVAMAEDLVASRINDIAAWAHTLNALAARLGDPDNEPVGYASCLERWRFSAFQRNQLRTTLRAIQLLQPGFEVCHSDMFTIRERGPALEWLHAYYHSLPLHLSADTAPRT